ncbi:MAG: hypothetical protein R3A12_00140 [Ignavibacteria bacterium]
MYIFCQCILQRVYCYNNTPQWIGLQLSGLAGSPALGSVDQFAPLFSESAYTLLPPCKKFSGRYS